MNLINTLKLHMAGHKYLPSERVTSFFFEFLPLICLKKDRSVLYFNDTVLNSYHEGIKCKYLYHKWIIIPKCHQNFTESLPK